MIASVLSSRSRAVRRQFGLIALAAAAAILLLSNAGLAQPQPAPAKELTKEQKELLKERGGYEVLAYKLMKEGKLAEAVATAEKMLVIERKVFGEFDPEVAISLQWITNLHVRLKDFSAARRASEERLAIQTKIHGEKHWRTTDARLDLAEVGIIAKLMSAQRKEIQEADRLMKLATAEHQAGRFQQGADAAKKALEIRARILGTEHRLTAYSALAAARLLEMSGSSSAAIKYFEQTLAIREKMLGEEHPVTVSSLHELGEILQRKGEYAAAQRCYEQLLAINKKVVGEQHPDTARSLSNLGALLRLQGNYADAQPCLEHAIAIRKKVLGEEHPDTVGSLHELGVVLHGKGDYAAARRCYEQVLAINKKLLGGQHPNTATTLHNLGTLLLDQGEHAAARPCLEQALSIRKKVMGEQHPDTAASLNRLGSFLLDQRDYAAARPYLEQALAIRKKVLGEEHPDTVFSLNALGVLLHGKGDYAGARLCLEQVLTIDKKVRGEQHPDTARSLSNLGTLLCEQGDYAAARPCLEQALNIRREKLGKQHPDTANSLDRLGLLLNDQGDYAAARPYLEQALNIRKEVLGKQHPRTVDSLNNLGALLVDQGDYAAARSCLEQALAIRQKVEGEEHSLTATSLDNLGMLLAFQGDFAGARPYCEQALNIRKKVLGEQHPSVATSLNNLGMLLRDEGDYAGACRYMERALDISKKGLGEHHPLYSNSLANLSDVLQAAGQTERAFAMRLQAIQIQQGNLQRVLQLSSERSMFAAVDQASASHPILLTMVADARAKGDIAAALTWTVRRKGVVFDTVLNYRQAQALLPADDPLAEKVNRYRGLHHLLNNAALNPPAGWTAERLTRECAAWRKDADELEGELNRALSRRFPGQFSDYQAENVATVREKLPPGTVLVEFVRISPYDFKATLKARAHRWLPARYLVFVLTPGKAPPQMLDLGEAKAIDDAVLKLRAHFDRAPNPDTSIEDYWPEAKAVHKLVFAPLRQHLGNAKTIYLAADGLLNQVPFEALVDEKGKFLIESHRFAYQTSGRDLLRPAGESAKGVVVFAGPDFDLDPLKRKDQVERLTIKGNAIALRGDPAKETRGKFWKALPGAKAEAGDIGKIMGDSSFGPVRTYVGAEAIEDVLKTMPAPRILHLATHGYYFDHEPKAPADLIGLGLDVNARLRKADNPLLRSGIVLAGANTIDGKVKTPGVEDGWVTAAEVGLLNLRGTELVVLSACQTGLGDVKTGEGVFGLRRAFLHAGARSMLTSLFEVPDDDTRLLMERFYTNLKANRSKLDALHEAQLSIIRDRQRAGDVPHPFYWGGFVLVGDPR